MSESNDDELKARRQIDLENLNEIPKISATVNFISSSITKIEKIIEDYPVTKEKVNYLARWHWIIVTAVTGSVVGLVVMLIFKR